MLLALLLLAIALLYTRLMFLEGDRRWLNPPETPTAELMGRDGVPGGRTGAGTGSSRKGRAVPEEDMTLAGRPGVPGRRVGGGSRNTGDPIEETLHDDLA